MHPSIRRLAAGLAISASLCGVQHVALAQAAAPTPTQLDPPATPLVSPSDKPQPSGVTPLGASSGNTLTIAPGAIPPMPAGVEKTPAPQGSLPAR